jgi:uncharacterized Zn finger protein
VDLQIEPGRITAMVAGSELYTTKINIKPASAKAWSRIRQRCAGQIGSLIELLQGRLSQGVMQIITDRDGGLFPRPAEIQLACSCPDWADMCKHVAAVLYGVGARLDENPELLFLLRKVDHLELIARAGSVSALAKKAKGQKTIASDELADVFGIELDVAEEPVVAVTSVKPGARKPKASGTQVRPPRKNSPPAVSSTTRSVTRLAVSRTGASSKPTRRGLRR